MALVTGPFIIIIIITIGASGGGGGGLRLCPVLMSSQRTGCLTKYLTGGCVREYWNECIKPGAWESDMIMSCQSLYQLSGLHHCGILSLQSKCLVRPLFAPGTLCEVVNRG